MMMLGISHLITAIVGIAVGGVIGMFYAGSLLIGGWDD